MSNVIDYWKDGDFEESVSAGLIACYESKIKKMKAPSSVRLDDESLKQARLRGLYFPSNSRIILDPRTEKIDMVNDVLPEFGCVCMRKENDGNELNYNGYIHLFSFAKKNDLPKNFYKRGGGVLYQMDNITPSNDYVEGEKTYFTVSKDGNIRACSSFVSNQSGYGGLNKIITQEQHEPEYLKAAEFRASVALQWVADKKHCWTITAKENIAKATLGCMMEEVKSLLYARSLPMTATGRKRPILHLVESHKRRMRNGTDIDVTSFLRGQQTVEIGGTIFSVNPPRSLMPNLSKKSQMFATAD